MTELHTAPVSGHERTVVFASMLVTLFLAALDQTIVATALPRMVADLDAVDRYSWVATAYLLASTALALIYGKLADTYARKKITLVAVALFLGGSVLCGLAGELGTLPVLGDGMNQLVLFRGVQGLGGGGIFAMTFIIIADLFTPAERGRYQGYVGAVFGVASVLGPLAGGFLTDHAGGLLPGIEGWRWVFYVNLPFGGIALWMIVRRMPMLEPVEPGARPDLPGAVLLLLGLLPLLLAVQLDKVTFPWIPDLADRDPGTGWRGWVTSGCFFAAAVPLWAFWQRSRSVPSPILDPTLFRNPVFRFANAATFFFGGAVMSITIFLPLLAVRVLDMSATAAGATLIPFSMGVVVGATLAGRFVNRLGYRPQIFGGGLLFAAAVLGLAEMEPGTGTARVTLCATLSGLGAGPSMPLFTLAVQNAVDVRRVGQATSASQFFRQIGATFGAALMGTLLVASLWSAFGALEVPANVASRLDIRAERLVATGGAGMAEDIRELYRTRAAGTSLPDSSALTIQAGERIASRIQSEVGAAFVQAARRIYLTTAVMILIATALTLLIPELELRATHDRDVPPGRPGRQV